MDWNAQFIAGNAGMAVAIVLAGYLLGCFATGYYLVKWKTGQDIRQLGSGNTGARNAGRALGRSGFFLTMAGDFAKGTLAVGLAYFFTKSAHIGLLALLAVVLGHMWPAQLGFRGGKGICTSVGGLVLFPSLVICLLLMFGIVFAFVRKTTLSGMVAYALLPAVCFFLKLDGAHILGVSLLTLLVLFAHRRNTVEDVTALSRPSLSGKPNPSIKKT